MSAYPQLEAVRRALALLNRASSEWRATAGENGPLHWPTAIALATRELRAALEAPQADNERCVHCGGSGSDDDNPCPRCGGTGFEGDDPCAFCEATGCDAKAEDARAGMAWFNALTRAERSYWLMVAESARPADAWRAFQAWSEQP